MGAMAKANPKKQVKKTEDRAWRESVFFVAQEASNARPRTIHGQCLDNFLSRLCRNQNWRPTPTVRRPFLTYLKNGGEQSDLLQECQDVVDAQFLDVANSFCNPCDAFI